MSSWRHSSHWYWLWNKFNSRPCWSVSKQPVGYSVWWLLGLFWCKSCVQTDGILRFWYVPIITISTRFTLPDTWFLLYFELIFQTAVTYNDLMPALILLTCCTGPVALQRARFGQGNDVPILLDNVQCTGSESRLIDCTYSAVHNCAHSEDASVNCTTRMHILYLLIF